jgi:hypothetical protein
MVLCSHIWQEIMRAFMCWEDQMALNEVTDVVVSREDVAGLPGNLGSQG